MTVDLMISRSDTRALSKVLEGLYSLTGSLKDTSSILDPVILVEMPASNLALANYARIPDFGRYYYITDMVSVRSTLTEVHMHVDVLMSWAEGILGNQGIIRRQENEWNLYLNDGSFKIYQNSAVLTRPFPSGFTTQEFVLAVAGS